MVVLDLKETGVMLVCPALKEFEDHQDLAAHLVQLDLPELLVCQVSLANRVLQARQARPARPATLVLFLPIFLEAVVLVRLALLVHLAILDHLVW